MASTSEWGMTPRQSVERECRRRGPADVVAGCRALLRGEQVDPSLVMALGGPAAERHVQGEPREDAYWLRVWGARGLLWVWEDEAVPEVRLALADESWRVREMALKVIARHEVGDLMADVAASQEDPVPRVRQAAARTLSVLTAAEA